MASYESDVDPAVRDRAVRQIELFQDALDEATVNPSPANKEKLREAADEVMRAVAGVMVEVSKQQH
jgi:hypothetical protein